MKRIYKSSQYQTFIDGHGSVWEVVDRRIVAVKQDVVHFAEATVGERRFWDAYVEGTEITRAIKVPYPTNVERGDVFVIENDQYMVVQKDLKDTLPTSWLLSLQKSPIDYNRRDT